MTIGPDPDYVFTKPMLATATTSFPSRGRWVAEEKYDGHRLLVRVTERGSVIAWSRLGNRRELPPHLREQLAKLAVGLYDGELIVPHGISSNVADLSNQSKLVYVMFDVLELTGEDSDGSVKLAGLPWRERRRLLERVYNHENFDNHIQLSSPAPVRSWEDVMTAVQIIWDAGGEGVILKDTDAPYQVGKRTKTFLKVKQCQPAALRIIGFANSEGEIMQYGAFGTAVLQDQDGVIVPVKVLDDNTRKRLNDVDPLAGECGLKRTWREVRLLSGKKVEFHTDHPWVGKVLHIEYQCRTEDGSYRHPRWDRLDGE